MSPGTIAALALMVAGLLAPPGAAQGRLSEKGITAQTIAGTTITVEYYRPAARGREKLFGGVVTWGEHWTPGANWATTVDVDHDVRVEGRLLPKGKYSLWTVVRPDTWTVAFHRRSHLFHTNRPDSTDEQLRLQVRPDSGPPTEVLTFDFPEVRPAATTLRLRWGTVVVPLRFSGIADPLPMVPSPAVRGRYLGRYDLEVLPGTPGVTPGRRLVDIVQAGDTLRWRDADGPEAERRDFILSPAGEDDFSRARRAADGQYWPDGGVVVSFTVANGRTSGFEVQTEDGTVVSRARRMPG
jgi:hypothetical protein